MHDVKLNQKIFGKLVKLMRYGGTFPNDGDKWNVWYDTLWTWLNLSCTTGYMYTTTGLHMCTLDKGFDL